MSALIKTCANGGSSFTSAGGTAYACNGASVDGSTIARPDRRTCLRFEATSTFNGTTSTLQVSTDNTTGAGSMTGDLVRSRRAQ